MPTESVGMSELELLLASAGVNVAVSAGNNPASAVEKWHSGVIQQDSSMYKQNHSINYLAAMHIHISQLVSLALVAWYCDEHISTATK